MTCCSFPPRRWILLPYPKHGCIVEDHVPVMSTVTTQPFLPLPYADTV